MKYLTFVWDGNLTNVEFVSNTAKSDTLNHYATEPHPPPKKNKKTKTKKKQPTPVSSASFNFNTVVQLYVQKVIQLKSGLLPFPDWLTSIIPFNRTYLKI